jgi:hypothetical protein
MLAKLITEVNSRPNDYITNSRGAAIVIGREVANQINKNVAEGSASTIGDTVGRIIGRVVFEILLTVILAMISGGAGGAVKGGMAMGEATRGGSVYARLAARLEEVLEGLPALRKIIIEMLGELPANAERILGREVFSKVKEAIIRSGANPADKARALELCLEEIHAADSSWKAIKSSTAAGEIMWTGEGRPFGLLMDSSGVLWQTANVAEAGRYGTMGGKFGYIPDLAKWSRLGP